MSLAQRRLKPVVGIPKEKDLGGAKTLCRTEIPTKGYGLSKPYCSEAFIVERDRSPYFNIFLKFYKIFFCGMLLFSLGATAYSALKSNYSDAFEPLRGAIIFAAFLWCGYNVYRLEARLKAKS